MRAAPSARRPAQGRFSGSLQICTPKLSLRPGGDHHEVVPDPPGLDAEHLLPGVVGELRETPGLVHPGVPDHRRARVEGVQVDAAFPARVLDQQVAFETEVDAIQFALDPYRAVLSAFFPVLQGLDVARAFQALDGDLAAVADREVGVQCLAEHQRLAAEVLAGESQGQALAEAEQHAQRRRVRPAGEAIGGVEVEADAEVAVLLGDVVDFPVDRPDQPVGGRLQAIFHLAADFLRVALQRTEPRPAHRHPAAYRLPAPVAGLVAEPDQRRLFVGLVAEQLRALLGDQRLAMGGVDAPAGQVVDLYLFDAVDRAIGVHGGLREANGWQQYHRSILSPAVPLDSANDDAARGPRRLLPEVQAARNRLCGSMTNFFGTPASNSP